MVRMATLNWIGKEAVVNHDKEVPFKLLKKVPSASVGKKSKNLIVHGDNLEALKALMPFYKGKVKCIYIDPPYNTGNENWIYNDKVNSPKIREWLGKVVGMDGEDLTRHDKWLCMMYPRLKLLSDLLRDDGIIFVSIDDNEAGNLRLLLDEIFAEYNFLATFTWVRKKKGSFLSKKIRKMTEYVLCYQKAQNDTTFFGEEAYSDKWQPLVKRTNSTKKLSFNKDLIETTLADGTYKASFYGKPDTGINVLRPFAVKDSRVVTDFVVEAKFVWTQTFLDSELKSGTRVSLSSQYGLNVLRHDQGEKIKTPSTLISGENMVGTNEDATAEISSLFNKEIGTTFDYPKPTSLIKYLVKMVTANSDEEVIILDSFAGSGTTGHAVLDLNKEDSGNRKFVLIEMVDEVAKNVTAERVKRAIKKYEYDAGFEYCELDEPLFDERGQINEECSYDELATYVYFTETQTNLEKKTIKKPFIGESHGTSYYLIYAGKDKNDLTRVTIEKLKLTGPAVIYADRCLVDEDELEENGIVFKQIPYEIKVY